MERNSPSNFSLPWQWFCSVLRSSWSHLSSLLPVTLTPQSSRLTEKRSPSPVPSSVWISVIAIANLPMKAKPENTRQPCSTRAPEREEIEPRRNSKGAWGDLCDLGRSVSEGLLSPKLLLLAAALIMSSCHTTRYIPMPEHHTEYIHDTILRADSIYVSHYLLQRGDTIWMTDTVLKYLYRDKVVEVIQHDSIPYPVEVPIEVAKPIPRFYKNCTAGFFLIILCIILYVFLRIYLRR